MGFLDKLLGKTPKTAKPLSDGGKTTATPVNAARIDTANADFEISSAPMSVLAEEMLLLIDKYDFDLRDKIERLIDALKYREPISDPDLIAEENDIGLTLGKIKDMITQGEKAETVREIERIIARINRLNLRARDRAVGNDAN